MYIVDEACAISPQTRLVSCNVMLPSLVPPYLRDIMPRGKELLWPQALPMAY